MITLASILFWLAAALIVYAYLLFPVIVFVRGVLKQSSYEQAPITPTVSLVIAARNEAEIIGAKLDNVLAQDYPSEKIEIIIATDGSDDGTNEIVDRYRKSGVRLLPLQRVGKAEALNAAVAISTGEILVFSDANSMFAPDAIRELMKPFADPEVGGVAGNQCYLSEAAGGPAGDGEKGYWSYDRWLKLYESAAGNTISATGAIYAIRHRLFQEVPNGVTDDFYISTGTIAQGFRLVFAPDAIAYEPVAASSGREFGRKVRVITRGFQSVLMRRALLNPFRHGAYAFQLLSHKLIRRLVVFPLVLILLVTPLLWSFDLFYKFALLGQIGFYLLAILGALLSGMRAGRSKIISLPFYFCLVNLASLVAAMNILRGHRIDQWEPQRENSDPAGHRHDQAIPTSERINP